MNYSPTVSVIIAVYNGKQYIRRAIVSVLNQTYKDIEIIVVDDGSTDNTKRMLDVFNIKYIYQENAGSINARNNGIRNSRGEYIAILDSDDIWCDRNKLKKQVEFLDTHPYYVLVGGNMIKVNAKHIKIRKYTHPENDKDIREAMLFGNMFAHSTVVFRKSAWACVGGYGDSDWNLWLKLGIVGKLYNFQDYFVHYLEGGQNTSYCNIRQSSRSDIELRKKYHAQYPNFWKAFIWAWISYFYSYFPFKEQIYALRRKNL